MITGYAPDWALGAMAAHFGAKYDSFDKNFLQTLPSTYNWLKYSAISYFLASIFLLEIDKGLIADIVKEFSTSIGGIYDFSMFTNTGEWDKVLADAATMKPIDHPSTYVTRNQSKFRNPYN